MGAMRSASEQQLLAHARLGGVTESGPNSGTEPSMECLMTLLWATQVIDRERQRQDEALGEVEQIDAVTEVRQACEELDELFRSKSVKRMESDDGFACIQDGDGSQKSKLEGRWSMAFQQ